MSDLMCLETAVVGEEVWGDLLVNIHELQTLCGWDIQLAFLSDQTKLHITQYTLDIYSSGSF